jgi:O-antigen/teichoic acid export membrane protein
VIAYNFLVELFTALRNIRLVSVMQLVNSVAFAMLALGMLLSWQCTAASVLVAYGGSCLIAVAWAGRNVVRTLRVPTGSIERARCSHQAFPSTVWTKIAPFAAWILLGNVVTNLFGVLDRYMIVHFSRMSPVEALEAVGNYQSSRVVPLLLVSIAGMLATMALPHLSHDWEAGRRDLVAARLRLFLKLLGFALFAAATAVLLAAPLLFHAAFRNKFPEGEAVLPLALVYCMWFGLSLVMQNYLLCAEKARLASVALFCGLLLNIPLNIMLLPRLGLEGAVLSTAAANALSLVIVCWFNRRLGFHLDDGAKLVLALPMLVCLGPWVCVFALVAVAADAIWADRLLSAEEKRQLAEGAAQYAKRFGLDRWMF